MSPDPKLNMTDPSTFRITIQGALDDTWRDYLALRSISIQRDEEGSVACTLTTAPVDQAALIGLVVRLYALGLPLVAIECLPEVRNPSDEVP